MDNVKATPKRIVVVSNRLPFTVVSENGEIRFKDSVGGVATGLKSILSLRGDPQSVQPEYLCRDRGSAEGGAGDAARGAD